MGMMAEMQYVAGLEALNVLILLALLFVYWRNYSKIKSRFTLGLFVFAAFFLVQNLVALYFQFSMMEYYSPLVAGHAVTLSLLQAIGFGVLLLITWK